MKLRHQRKAQSQDVIDVPYSSENGRSSNEEPPAAFTEDILREVSSNNAIVGYYERQGPRNLDSSHRIFKYYYLPSLGGAKGPHHTVFSKSA